MLGDATLPTGKGTALAKPKTVKITPIQEKSAAIFAAFVRYTYILLPLTSM